LRLASSDISCQVDDQRLVSANPEIGLSSAPSAARGTKFQVSRTLAGQTAYRVEEEDRLLIFDAQGTLLAEYPWPAPGTKYVGSGNPEDPAAHARIGECQRCPDKSFVRDVLMQNRQRCPDTSQSRSYRDIVVLRTFCAQLIGSAPSNHVPVR
jgi:hypothetical protein